MTDASRRSPRRLPRRPAGLLLPLLLLVACANPPEPSLYEKVPVDRRDIVVSASAAGVLEPVRVVDVKSKASGEIIELDVETGDDVRTGQLLAVIDPRLPKNTLAQAEADLQVAQAQLEVSQTKLARADTLLKSSSITDADHEDARLAFVSARAQVVRARTDLENARDQMEDTRVRAPVTGTVIAKSVELGTVISSPTRDVGGGTVLLTMANLDTVQIRTLIDETDIGKVKPGLPATIMVDAYPNRPFTGTVLKIEPRATVQQNVTMFPALVRIANPGHLLMPGMNAEVEVHVGRRENVLAVPYAALRTPRDVASAASVLGIEPDSVASMLRQNARPAPTDTSAAAAPAADSVQKPGGRPGGGPGAGGRQWARGGGGGGGPGGGAGPGGGGHGGAGPGGGWAGGGGRFIVFVLRDGSPRPVEIQTGLSDLDYVEVLSGVEEGDTVLVLPSASLVASQEQVRERIQRMTGGGIPGMQQQGGASPPPVRR